MSHREPPRLAAWMLEHLVAGDPDEAVAGDLLEVLRAGRTDGWYWRQVLAVCGVSWTNALRARLPLLVFAFLWSLLSPAWSVFLDRVLNARLLAELAQMSWPASLLSRVAVWVILNSTFLWAGMLVYLLCHSRFTHTVRNSQIGRALLLAPAILLPAYVTTFVLMNLLAFPGFDIDRSAFAPLSEVVDLRTWAVVLRVPYFVTMVCALWRSSAMPRRRSAINGPVPLSIVGRYGFQSAVLDESSPDESAAPIFPPFAPRTIVAGSMAAMVAVFLCSFASDRIVSAIGLVPAAILCLAAAVFAGAGGAVLLGGSEADRSWRRALLVSLVCGPAWVWLPAAILLGRRDSIWALPVSAAASALMAVCLRHVAFPAEVVAGGVSHLPLESVLSSEAGGERELFARTLQVIPWDWHGFAIAVFLYAAFLLHRNGQSPLACVSAAACAYLFASQWIEARRNPSWLAQAGVFPDGEMSTYTRIFPDGKISRVRPLMHAAMPALLVTLIALMASRPWFPGAEGSATQLPPDAPASKPVQQASQSLSNGYAGYQSIVLWPIPPRKEIVAPIPVPNPALEPRMNKPIVVRFTGAYWYFQPPAPHPDGNKHIAQGDPLKVSIHSTNSRPLRMEADQMLAAPIRTSRCRQIEVAMENRETLPGGLSIAMVLTGPSGSARSTLFLGSQPVVSSLGLTPIAKDVPATETLHFMLPVHPALRRFDEITLIVEREGWPSEAGARVAIDELQILPR